MSDFSRIEYGHQSYPCGKCTPSSKIHHPKARWHRVGSKLYEQHWKFRALEIIDY